MTTETPLNSPPHHCQLCAKLLAADQEDYCSQQCRVVREVLEEVEVEL